MRMSNWGLSGLGVRESIPNKVMRWSKGRERVDEKQQLQRQ